MKRFIGRECEYNLLVQTFSKDGGKLVVIYGRRRIGKSALVKDFATKVNGKFLYFEGLENQHSSKQISRFVKDLAKQTKDPFLKSFTPSSWDEVFDYLSQIIIKAKKKIILCLDEFQWLAANRSALVSLLKVYWDNQWKDRPIMLILCGSIASFMVNRVINSKALYGRIDLEILLGALKPDEAAKLIGKKRGHNEIIKYLMIFGGVPKYLELIDVNKSFSQNMNLLCFSKSGFMVNELDKIFFSQFKEAKNYLRLVDTLKDKALTLTELAGKFKVDPGGTFQQYLVNLEKADFITGFVPLGGKPNSKLKRYKLTDEFLVFYFKYMKPNHRIISKSESSQLFEQLCESKWQSWLGLAFERFCLKHALYLAKIMGFGDKVIDFGPYYEYGDKNFQIDLLYKRADKIITLCEIKFHDKPINTSIISEIERKSHLYSLPRGYSLERALITVNGIDKSLNLTDYFHHVLSVKDIL